MGCEAISRTGEGESSQRNSRVGRRGLGELWPRAFAGPRGSGLAGPGPLRVPGVRPAVLGCLRPYDLRPRSDHRPPGSKPGHSSCPSAHRHHRNRGPSSRSAPTLRRGLTRTEPRNPTTATPSTLETHRSVEPWRWRRIEPQRCRTMAIRRSRSGDEPRWHSSNSDQPAP